MKVLEKLLTGEPDRTGGIIKDFTQYPQVVQTTGNGKTQPCLDTDLSITDSFE